MQATSANFVSHIQYIYIEAYSINAINIIFNIEPTFISYVRIHDRIHIFVTADEWETVCLVRSNYATIIIIASYFRMSFHATIWLGKISLQICFIIFVEHWGQKYQPTSTTETTMKIGCSAYHGMISLSCFWVCACRTSV